MPNKYDEAITKLEGLRAQIDEELAVVRADAVADADKKNGKGGDDGDKTPNNSSNPFYKLRNKEGVIDKAVEANVGRMIGAMGHKKVSDIARAATSPAAPLGLTLTGLPIRP